MQRGLQSSQGSDPGFRLEVDLKLPGRGVSALFGPSGCGKTTLLRCLAGLEPAAHGRLVIDGQTWHDDVEQWPPHRRAVGLVFQEASLFEHLDVRGNIAFGWRRVPAADRRISVQQAA
ncbi:MAG: ATP-binding cassette domain-containing protein, partial [Aquabacterium sp.]|nr:ATP-binding cassette domain-containing protein [Aquabacterium sp.]